ncbi:MAG: ATP-binding protein [Balneolaceae bacterium]|nr:ATP-binding protein [Balneolaceae bacterium]
MIAICSLPDKRIPDYTGFLSMLLSEELEAREGRKVDRLLRAASFGNPQSLEAFDVSLSTGVKPTRCGNWPPAGLLISGKA